MKNSLVIVIILFELGWSISFNLIGTLTLSELFLILSAPFYVTNAILKKDNDLAILFKLYLFLLGSQIVAELFVSNGFDSSLKGISITIVSFLHVNFLYRYIKQDLRLIGVLVLFQVVMMIVRGPAYDAEGSVMSALEGESVVWLKFYFAPIIRNVLLLCSLLFYRKVYPIIFIVIGMMFVVAGARSGGGMMCIIGLGVYMLQNNLFVKKFLKIGIVIVCMLGYCLYVLYVDSVMSGRITAGNNIQLLDCNNPYNPIELLMRGRSEVWCGWIALKDKPLFGHGAWAIDGTHYYARMMALMHDDNFVYDPSRRYLVPAHSVVIGYGVWHGMFASLGIIFIVVFFIKRMFRIVFNIPHKYQLLLVSFAIQIIWNTLFSPNSHFRQTLPISFAIILSLYYFEKKHKRVLLEKKNSIDC